MRYLALVSAVLTLTASTGTAAGSRKAVISSSGGRADLVLATGRGFRVPANTYEMLEALHAGGLVEKYKLKYISPDTIRGNGVVIKINHANQVKIEGNLVVLNEMKEQYNQFMKPFGKKKHAYLSSLADNGLSKEPGVLCQREKLGPDEKDRSFNVMKDGAIPTIKVHSLEDSTKDKQADISYYRGRGDKIQRFSPPIVGSSETYRVSLSSKQFIGVVQVRVQRTKNGSFKCFYSKPDRKAALSLVNVKEEISVLKFSERAATNPLLSPPASGQ